MAKKKEILIDITELENEIKGFEQSVTKPIADGVLDNGLNYQVQVTITTDEDDFIE